MKRNNSDKGLGWHNYTVLYDKLFEGIRYNDLRIFELGIGTNNVALPSNMGPNGTPGASLRGWKEYFPNSLVFGADIDSDILFSEDRIQTFYCDQTNPCSISQMWGTIPENFDIMIDDGLHKYDANVTFFENSIYKLNRGGFYIIEDVLDYIIPQFESKIVEWRDKYPHLEFKLEIVKHDHNILDNNLIIVRNCQS